MDKRYLVIDIGGTFTKYAIMDMDCNFYIKDKVPTVKSDLAGFVDMLAGIYESVQTREESQDLCGIAISSAGMIDSATGFMYNCGSVPAIKNINLKEILEKHCGLPVTVENDGHCAGLAELWKGSLADCRNAIAMIIGTAVGGAIIVDGNVLKGKDYMAGEFSYILTNASDAQNPNETFAIKGGMPQLLKLASDRMEIPTSELSGEYIFSCANCGEEIAMGCIKEYARILAVQINNLHFVFNPEKIAIGGGVSAQPLLLQLIREELTKLVQAYPNTVPTAEITNCMFFNDSNLIGALYVHLKSQEVVNRQKRTEELRELLELLGTKPKEQYLRELLVSIVDDMKLF